MSVVMPTDRRIPRTRETERVRPSLKQLQSDGKDLIPLEGAKMNHLASRRPLCLKNHINRQEVCFLGGFAVFRRPTIEPCHSALAISRFGPISTHPLRFIPPIAPDAGMRGRDR